MSGLFGDIFGSTKDTSATTSGTTNSQNNLFPWLQNSGFLNQFQQQYSPGNIANAQVGFNPYQTGAANNLAGAGANLQPGFGAATGIAQNGIPLTGQGSIQSFMSPYTQQVVDATQKQFNTQNGIQNSQNSAYAAKQGALTGSGAGNLRAQTQMAQQTAQAPVIAGLYNQGFNTAANLAGQSAQTQLGGVNALGSLTNAGTGANSALGSLGNSFWGQQYQNAMTPFTLNNQAIQGFGGLGQLAGQNTQSQGQSTGTQTSTDSPWNIGTDIFAGGKALGFFQDGGRVGKSDGGSVLPRYEGASSEPKPFHHKVAEAFDHFLGMRKKAAGGEVQQKSALPRFDIGGGVGGYDENWGNTTVTPANQDNSALQKWAASHHQQSSTPDNSLGQFQDNLSKFMQGMSRQPGMADGGDPWAATVDYAADQPGPTETETDPSYMPRYRDTGALTDLRSNLGGPQESPFPRYTPMAEAPAPRPSAPMPPSGGGVKDWLSGIFGGNRSNEGIMSGGAMTPSDRTAMIVSGMGGGKIAKTIGDLQEQRFKEISAKQMADKIYAENFGEVPGGRQTMAGLKAPLERAYLEAETRAKDPANVANKILLMQKLDRGEELTPEDIRAVYGTTAPSGAPASGTPNPAGAAPPRAPAPATGGTGLPAAPPKAAMAPGEPGSKESPVYAPTPEVERGLPPGTWYTTPASLEKPQQKLPSVPQGGDPTARTLRANASPPSTVERPFRTDEDKRLTYMHMLDPTLRTTLENTPGHKGRVKEEELRAAKRIETEEKQTQGRELERQLNELETRMVNAGPEVLNYATGPYLSDPTWQKRLALMPFANGKGSVLEQAQVLNTKVQHTIDALSTQYSALSGGKVTSDAARAELKAAVGEAFKSRGPEGVFEILHDAKRNIQGLAHLPIDELRKDYYPEQWRKQGLTPQPAPGAPEGASRGLSRDELRSMPDGLVTLPNGRFFKQGSQFNAVSGPVGSATNPHNGVPLTGPELKEGEYVWDNGKMFQKQGWRMVPVAAGAQ